MAPTASTDAADDDLRIAVLRLSRRMRLERESTDVTDSQLSVLFALWRLGPQTLRALAEHDRVSPPSMNRTVGTLVDAGFVTREQSPDDGRKVTVAATEAGVEFVTAFKKRRDAWFSPGSWHPSTPRIAPRWTPQPPILARIADA